MVRIGQLKTVLCAPGVGLAAWLLVLTLAVLNPVACLIHCAIYERAPEVPQAHAFFLCTFHTHSTSVNATTGSTESPVPASGISAPRAFYESVPAAVFLLAAVTVVLFVTPRAAVRFPQLRATPPTPPPRYVGLSNS